MDRIEQLFRDSRTSLDREEPTEGMWHRLKGELTQPPVPPSNSSHKGWLFASGLLLFVIAMAFVLWPKAPISPFTSSQTFPDIVMQSPEGNTRALSDLDGKVVLVEFWASWCNVCSEKNCNDLLPVYDMYKDRGFEIYAISVDEDHRQWINGIESHHLPWIHVSDLQGFASPISQRFDVNQTPTTYLLDEERRVIGKNLTREELESKLMDCYGF
jgi:peroxiredoxin